MCVLYGDDFTEPDDGTLITDLSYVIFYMNFDRIFDRNTSRKHLERQRKAEDMFRPGSLWLDFGAGPRSYVAFELSGSMSRQEKRFQFCASLCRRKDFAAHLQSRQGERSSARSRRTGQWVHIHSS